MVLLGAGLNGFRIVYLDAIPTDQLPTDAAASSTTPSCGSSGPTCAPSWSCSCGRRRRVGERARSGTRSAYAAAGRALDAVRHGRDRAGLSTGPVGEFLHTYRSTIRVGDRRRRPAYVLTDHPTGESTLVIVVAGVLLLVSSCSPAVSRPPTPARRLSPAPG